MAAQKPMGRKPVPEIKKARRTAWAAYAAFRKAESDLKRHEASAASKKQKKLPVGKQPKTPREIYEKASEELSNAIEYQHEIESSLGLPHMSESELNIWITEIGDDGKPNDYFGTGGRPGGGEIASLYKSLRRYQSEYAEADAMPEKWYAERLAEHESREGKKGRRPLSKSERLEILSEKIAGIEADIADHRSKLSELDNLKVDLDIERVDRRNICAEIYARIGIKATDDGAQAMLEEWLSRSTKIAAEYRARLEPVQARIESLEAKVQLLDKDRRPSQNESARLAREVKKAQVLAEKIEQKQQQLAEKMAVIKSALGDSDIDKRIALLKQEADQIEVLINSDTASRNNLLRFDAIHKEIKTAELEKSGIKQAAQENPGYTRAAAKERKEKIKKDLREARAMQERAARESEQRDEPRKKKPAK